MNKNKVSIKIRMVVGDETLEVSGTSPLHLSSDRRRWRKQIADHIAANTELLSQRFEVPTPTSTT